MIIPLLRSLFRLSLRTGRSWVDLLRSIVVQLLQNPQIAELWRFIFLGTVVQAGRVVGQKLLDSTSNLFRVQATFTAGDFSYDWVTNYLESHHVWDESRSFKVVAKNTADIPHSTYYRGKVDGHPDPVFEPAPQAPEFFRWHGYWISVNKLQEGYRSDSQREFGATLVLCVWSAKRQVLDDFVLEAREFYVNSSNPPKTFDPDNDPSNSLISATFEMGDWSHDWMLSYLRSENALKNVNDLHVSTKQSDLGWGVGPSDDVRYLPAYMSKQMFRFTAPRTGRKTWIQLKIVEGHEDYHGRMKGGSVRLTLHSSHRSVLDEIIEESRKQYMESSQAKVMVHIPGNYGAWAKTVTKSRRTLATLVLPNDVKEKLLADMQEFLASEQWYSAAGVPHRRGYLLHGEPGTGKSSTIHAMAGELGLEIYYISLAGPGIDDHNLAKLISDTPARSILLLEDIDCAFPSRSEGEGDSVELDAKGHPITQTIPPKSEVTLSGLLNVLDSVSSQEGRITFATTNHIENLDPALIRAGRMDVKIQYKLATSEQIEQVFQRFYPVERYASSVYTDSASTYKYTAEELTTLATRFAAAIPADSYSIAQIQGFLLNKKFDPLGAVEGVLEWVKEQTEERIAMEDLKRQRRLDAAKRRKEAKDLDEQLKREQETQADKEVASELDTLVKEAEAERKEPSPGDAKEQNDDVESPPTMKSDP